jgi:hypothetical protein
MTPMLVDNTIQFQINILIPVPEVALENSKLGYILFHFSVECRGARAMSHLQIKSISEMPKEITKKTSFLIFANAI